MVRHAAGKRVMGVPAETRKKRRPLAWDDEELSTTQKLARRECDWKGRSRRNGAHVREKLRNFGLRQEYDTHDPSGHEMLELPFLKKRSRIVEIVAANDLVFALAHSGVCVVFHRTTNKRVCYLNVHKDEVIRSLFYNKSCNAVITVSVYASENYSSLKCRSVPIEFIRRGQPDAGFPLFESESLKWPGFVEFDDVNGKVLTFSALDSIYKVFDLKNYNLLFEIRDKRVQEIKISPGIMLLIFERMANHVPLKILSIEDGTELKAFNHLLHRNKKIDFIEQFNEKLLVKQENENLQILDVLSGKVTEVNRTEFMTPSAFIFLYENQLFLTFRESTVGVWNFKGELVTSFEDHLLWHPDCNTNNIYINTGQDMIISYCRSGDGEQDRHRRPHSRGCKAPGSINVSNILTGRCLAKIQAPEGGSEADVRAQQALEEVTALFYDEERNEVLTGNKTGVVHVWTN